MVALHPAAELGGKAYRVSYRAIPGVRGGDIRYGSRLGAWPEESGGQRDAGVGAAHVAGALELGEDLAEAVVVHAERIAQLSP